MKIPDLNPDCDKELAFESKKTLFLCNRTEVKVDVYRKVYVLGIVLESCKIEDYLMKITVDGIVEF